MTTVDLKNAMAPLADDGFPKAAAVYCASSSKIPAVYFDAARRLGQALANAGLTAVSGGGRSGLMGTLIDGATEAGGSTIAVIPSFMVDRGWNHPGATKTIVTESMHERKLTMARLSRAAIALPGGCGTFEELLEIITWRQLGLFSGHVVIVNVDGYYDPLLALFDRAVDQHFMNPDHRGLFHLTNSVDEAVAIALAPVSVKNFTQKIV